MLISIPNHRDCPEKIQRSQDYIQALEEERRKIQVFQRELPLCLDLVTQAIETCKQQLSGTTIEYNLRGQSECSEQTSSPVFEEFIPLKRASFHTDGEEEESQKVRGGDDVQSEKNGNEKNSKKSDWLRYVQLWNETPDPSSKVDSPRKLAVVEVNRNSGSSGGSGGGVGSFHPCEKDKSLGINVSPTTDPPTHGGVPKSGSVPPASTSSTVDTAGGSCGASKKKEKGGESQRKARRCWSPELHTRFEQALQQLGGSHVATPKQIRELMKVDGLTDDEVKSHLQKYRLQMRRPGPTIQNNHHPQAPQFVVVGGVWVPPEYAAAVATATTSGDANGIYAPIASVPQPFQGTSTDHSPKQSKGGARVHIEKKTK